MKTLAIVGASGLVGERLLQIIQNKQSDVKIRLFANASAGKKADVRGKKTVIEPCCNLLDGKIDCAAFMATEEAAKTYVPLLAERNVTCVDNSAYFRLKNDVPLVVPCINGDLITEKTRVIANPNCSTIQTVIAVNALKSLEPAKLLAVTYQSVSGAGKDGLTDLSGKSGYGKLKTFCHPIYDNVIPCIGQIGANGLTSEETKMLRESRKILNMPRLKVNCFCCRVPVTVGHGVFVSLQCKQKIDLDEVKKLLKAEPNVLMLDDGLYPMPIMLANTKYVGVGRLRVDPTDRRTVNMFVVADNLMRGAAYNAYEILEKILLFDGDAR